MKRTYRILLSDGVTVEDILEPHLEATARIVHAGRRLPAQAGQGRNPPGLRLADELPDACPDAKVVNFCDREGDSRELLSEANRTGAALLVRAGHSTKRCVALPDSGERRMWAHVAKPEPIGCRGVIVFESAGRTPVSARWRCVARNWNSSRRGMPPTGRRCA